jgi:diguanylate cyclase (GGDEF)-like protein
LGPSGQDKGMNQPICTVAVVHTAGFMLAAMLFSAHVLEAAPPIPLASLHAIHSLSHAEAAAQPKVVFEATVTYRRIDETTLFVQDGNEGIYVWADAGIHLAPGDRILVRGMVQDSFRPIVIAENVLMLHHGSLPTAVPATFDELIRSQRDCERVKVRARVLSSNIGLSGEGNDIRMVLLSDGGVIDAYVNSGDSRYLDQILDAEVEVSGVAQLRFDGKMQPTGVALSIPLIEDIVVLKRAAESPWSLPITQMDEMITHYRVKNLSQRVRVQGIITYYQPGSAVVLQNGKKSLWIKTAYEKPLRVGDQADVTGLPESRDGFLTVADGEIQDRNVYAPVAAQPVVASQLSASKQIFDLVSVEAKVIMQVRENSQDEYVLVADGQVFSAIYRHPNVGGLASPPMNRLPLLSKVRVAGICILQGSNPYAREVPFNIIMRTPDDISVVERPSLLTVNNLIIVVGLLMLAMLAVGARGWFIERRVRRQTAAIAYIERRRSSILEDINGSLPLTEIIEEITELVSFSLKGAPCWCQIAGGARLGNCPKDLSGMRVVSQEIPARSAPSLGEVFAAFDPLTKPHDIEAESLASAVGLAALAIETRRLYSDLIRRSEFDLLTDIHNRFSLDNRLDAQIEEAYRQGSIFGLIYIDLDDFKKVNDNFGHRIGDFYLQEMALRMKRQLRTVDTLARLGGDEFAVLLPLVRSGADVVEIALRLERCFDEPLVLEGATLYPAASVGFAIYPEDGTTPDSLLSASDAAMYVQKHTKHSGRQPVAR